jgi:hypothetical protein
MAPDMGLEFDFQCIGLERTGEDVPERAPSVSISGSMALVGALGLRGGVGCCEVDYGESYRGYEV